MDKNKKSIYEPIKASKGKRLAAFLLDFILFISLFTGVMFIMSWITGYQQNSSLLQDAYIKYGIYLPNPNGNGYYMCSDSDSSCITAWENFSKDSQALYYYSHALELTLLIITVSAFISLLIFEFIIPLLLKNGRTIGMYVMKIGLIDQEGIKANHIQLFIRFLFGKFIILTALPLYGIMFLIFNAFGGGIGLILAVVIILLNFALLIWTKKSQGIADYLGRVYAINIEETMIFSSLEELNHYKALEKQNK